jgi:hypothetical protein
MRRRRKRRRWRTKRENEIEWEKGEEQIEICSRRKCRIIRGGKIRARRRKAEGRKRDKRGRRVEEIGSQRERLAGKQYGCLFPSHTATAMTYDL